MSRMEDDWSIEVGPVTTDDCWNCGAAAPHNRYCQTCRSGAGEFEQSTHAEYDVTTGDAWDAAPAARDRDHDRDDADAPDPGLDTDADAEVGAD